ncbi:hypothetical protein [Clostridium polynesiense]|uniref:hypothetical protein n=1 Tax=Clostridium polynesiense TaxID=1325933 RepID=UPI00058B9056|nr:hypothetical protein [Clostridium polynesiense]
MGTEAFYEYLKEIKEFWKSSEETVNVQLRLVTLEEKKRREKETDALIRKLQRILKAIPKDKTKKEQWKRKIEKQIDSAIERDSFFNLNRLTKEQKNSFFRSTEEFLERTRSFDKELSPEDICQALRNVWIVNILQGVMGEEIKLNSAILGYSLLYPYTDNFLDDMDIDCERKGEFNQRLMKRLKGEPINPIDKHEEKVFSLVSFIEESYPRKKYPQVYNSLQLINEGQIKSLLQQKTGEGDKDIIEEELLNISLEKGAASVLADGYLIRGSLTKEEEIFCLGYGFMLQLADDLQDVEVDINMRHRTLMTLKAGNLPLDTEVSKLINFTENIVNSVIGLKGEDNHILKDIIKTNCLMLILFSAVRSKEYFTEGFIENISWYLPFSINYIESLEERTKNWQDNFKGFADMEL